MTQLAETTLLRRYLESAQEALEAVSWTQNADAIPELVGRARAFCQLALQELEHPTERRAGESILEARS